MVAAVREMSHDWEFDVISIGFPGTVIHGKILREPNKLAANQVKYDFEQALGKPAKIINDATMQALGSYQGERRLFPGFGTGPGTVLIVRGWRSPEKN